MEELLKIENLSKIYKLYPSQKARFFEFFTGKKKHREVVALKDINLSLKEGESFGIVGENGAGKSTLIKVLTGVEVL
ncbi:MAG: ATP-binding cassette domain-containing protein, partial [Thermoanaerobaculia bacterium]